MWPLQVNYGWNCVENGPLDEDIALQVTERGGGPAQPAKAMSAEASGG
jgi:hypothetical protein